MMTQDPSPAQAYPLERFLNAQDGAQGVTYRQALAELLAGHKTSHWIWYVLPQLRGLGRSEMAHHYGLADLAEATAYFGHPVLGPRLCDCVRALLGHHDRNAQSILGTVDATKLHACLTLFAYAAPSEPLFRQALQRYFAGHEHSQTTALLGNTPPAP